MYDCDEVRVELALGNEEAVRVLVVDGNMVLDGLRVWQGLMVPVVDTVGESDGLIDHVSDIADPVTVAE